LCNGGGLGDLVSGVGLDGHAPPVTQDPRADELLRRDPLALLLGMLFDQRMGGRSS
jgi:hypothetical protein